MIDYINQEQYQRLKETFERDQRVHKTPVTKVEQDKREQSRSRPFLSQHLEPDGSVRHEVDLKAESENERRINFIKTRLDRMKYVAKRDFNRRR